MVIIEGEAFLMLNLCVCGCVGVTGTRSPLREMFAGIGFFFLFVLIIFLFEKGIKHEQMAELGVAHGFRIATREEKHVRPITAGGGAGSLTASEGKRRGLFLLMFVFNVKCSTRGGAERCFTKPTRGSNDSILRLSFFFSRL